MELPPNLFKRALGAGTVPLGTWLMAASPATAEALGCLGFDFLVVDMEHVPLDLGETTHILRAIAGTQAAAVVRLPWNDPVTVKRVLDLGAQTLMFPFVQSAEEARRAVAATRYPPDGMRGVAAMHRASRYGAVANYLGRAAAELAVIVQLETAAALERLAEIAAVPGVDALFVGPGDLAGSLGALGNIADPRVQTALGKAAHGARAAGKPIGIVGPTPAMVRDFVGMGYDYVAVASDMALMLRAAGEALSALRGSGTTKQEPGTRS